MRVKGSKTTSLVEVLRRRAPAGVAQTALALVTLAFVIAPPARAQRRPAPPPAPKAVTVKTHPNAAVWLDDVRRGTAGADGTLELKQVSPGAHRLRVRASGFAEQSFPLLPAQRGL